jgi:hypothetical protein
MITPIIKYIFLWIVLVLLQGLVLNNVHIFGGYGTPLLYVLFVLTLPFDTPKWLLYIVGFLTGLAIDSFTNTGGMHASAGVTLALGRIQLVKLLTPRDGYETGSHPSINNLGVSWWVSYSAILIVLHHLWLFAIEIFRVEAFGQVLLRTLASSIFTFLLLLVIQYLQGKKGR